MVGLAFWISFCGLLLQRTTLTMISYYTRYGSLGIHALTQVATPFCPLGETAN